MKRKLPSVIVLLAIGAVAVLGPGCIYFNLMYNAQAAFDTAYRAHHKLLKDNPDSSIVLPADVDNGYKKVIDKCNKVFEVYPKKTKWHPDALFLMGKAYFFDGEYDRSIHAFKQLQERFPASPFVPESHLYIGRAYLKKEDLDKAEEVLNNVLEKYPSLNKNQEVTVLMAEIAIHREGRSQALELLEKTYKSVKAAGKKLELAVKIAQLYKDVKLYDKAIAILESAPRPKDLPEQMFRVDFLRVTCYMEKGNLDRSLAIVTGMLKVKLYVSHVPVMLLRNGQLLDRLNRVDEAMALFKQITEIYGASDFVGNAWFELGRIYQIKKNDLAKAKECYDKASQTSKDASIKDLAAQRVKAIDAILKMRSLAGAKDTVKSDTVSPANYKIGELFWLELDQPDSAFKYYCASSRDTLHRAIIPKALYSAAWIARYALGDSAKADSLYDLLVKKYPANTYARKAQEAKGGAITIVTRQDSALDAFHAAERLYWENNNPDSAVEAYLKVYDDFRETEFGSKSLFAAAWINDFILDKNRSAKKLYELLCDSFPKSSYCLEARPRLKTVADTIAAMRAQKKLPERDGGTVAAPQKKLPERDGGTVAAPQKKPDAVAKDTSHQKSLSMPPAHDSASVIKSPPAAQQQTTPPPAPEPVPSFRYHRMRPGLAAADSAASGAVPASKPDSILKPSPASTGEVIGQ